MRKLFLAIICSFISYAVHSQDAVAKITKDYFRSDPFQTDFSAFLTHLLNDPNLSQKVIEKRTDSTLFYFEGTYSTFNPFFFKPKRVQVVLNEIVVAIDSLPRDTIYSYELIAYDDDTPGAVQEVKKEFEKIFRRHKGDFNSNRLYPHSPDDSLPGETYNFFDNWHAISPFAVSWLGPTPRKEMCLILTLRFDTYMNRAVLPMPFNTSQ